jgi:curved DNA-binding protein CbpA
MPLSYAEISELNKAIDAKIDFYKILNVSSSATDAEITSAYKKLALKFHPDRNPNNKEAEERFKELANAREALLDAEKRQYYDKERSLAAKEKAAANKPPPPNPFKPTPTAEAQRTAPPMSPPRQPETPAFKNTERSFESKSDIASDAIKLYERQFKKNGIYPNGYSTPQVSTQGQTQRVKLSFANQQEMMRFANQLASQGHQFEIKDAQSKVVAYSDGKQLFHANGKPYVDEQASKPKPNDPPADEQGSVDQNTPRFR